MTDPLPVSPEPTVDEILSDEIVQAMMAADCVDRYALEAMLAEVAQTLSVSRCRRLRSGSWINASGPR